MSLKDELMKSAKLDWKLQQAVVMTDDKDADNALYTIFIRASKPLLLEKQPEKGVTIRSNIEDRIYTADVTMEGLTSLVKNDKVESLQGARKLRLL